MSNEPTQYTPSQIEGKWQNYWQEHGTFAAKDGSEKPKFYGLDMFPYPSGAGLHIGHPEGYTATDILVRYKKANGFNVLHPMGWDAFGLPAEQYAIKTGTHPATTTRQNIENFRKQIQQIGFAIDWSREINTTDPEYYRWTQWIFLQLFKKGLVYVDERPVWWCPELRSVLANEEVVQGRSEVGNHPVERKNLRQVVLRITAYAERLLAGLKDLDWPDSTKKQQAAWIGRSEGAHIIFHTDTAKRHTIEVFTTRPDTLYGATYMVLAPEHPLVSRLVSEEKKAEVQAYIESAAKKSDLDRTDLAKDKTGVFTGSWAINPINGTRIPIWIADYVLISYGSGAIMAVPAHDDRDYEFAVKYEIPVQQVIQPSAEEGTELPFTGKGVLINSGEHSGMPSKEGGNEIIKTLGKEELAKATINYRLRDWIFSRQRYWGEPMPMVWVEKEAYEKALSLEDSAIRPYLPDSPVTTTVEGSTRYALPVPPSHLPLKLPEVESFLPSGTGESPLATLPDWVDVWIHVATGDTLPSSQPCPNPEEWYRGRRETNTMPQWAGSCWYHLRYLDPHNDKALVDPEKEKYWGSPDIYIGGNEHAVLHLLYARFWHQVLYDCGVVSTPEPYRKLFHQGIILGTDGEKMSKSRGNVINPEVVIEEYGADSLRLFEMFLGPLEDTKPWNPSGIEGVFRFLKKTWRCFLNEDGSISSVFSENAEDSALTKLLHQTIEKVTVDTEGMRFNTAISQMMILMNAMAKAKSLRLESALQFLRLLAPYAPHLCEEIWLRLGQKPSISDAPWPKADPKLLVTDECKYVIQINGKVRGELLVNADATKEDVLAKAKEVERVASHLAGGTIHKEIFVPGKIVNFVVG